jgi:hypothetical protein
MSATFAAPICSTTMRSSRARIVLDALDTGLAERAQAPDVRKRSSNCSLVRWALTKGPSRKAGNQRVPRRGQTGLDYCIAAT